jgi:hypothetical protein
MTTNMDMEKNVVEKFLMESTSVGNMDGHSDIAQGLLKEVANLNFSSSRGIEQVNALINEAETRLTSKVDEFARYKIFKWMSRAFTKEDPRGQLLSKEADRILSLLDVDNDEKANGEDLFAGVVGSGVDLVDGGRVVGSTSAETSSVPDQGTQQVGREMESSI